VSHLIGKIAAALVVLTVFVVPSGASAAPTGSITVGGRISTGQLTGNFLTTSDVVADYGGVAWFPYSTLAAPGEPCIASSSDVVYVGDFMTGPGSQNSGTTAFYADTGMLCLWVHANADYLVATAPVPPKPAPTPPPAPQPVPAPTPSPRAAPLPLLTGGDAAGYARTTLKRRCKNTYRHGYAKRIAESQGVAHQGELSARVVGDRRPVLPRPRDDLVRARRWRRVVELLLPDHAHERILQGHPRPALHTHLRGVLRSAARRQAAGHHAHGRADRRPGPAGQRALHALTRRRDAEGGPPTSPGGAGAAIRAQERAGYQARRDARRAVRRD
jgi:hypothetical protein